MDSFSFIKRLRGKVDLPRQELVGLKRLYKRLSLLSKSGLIHWGHQDVRRRSEGGLKGMAELECQKC